MGKETEKLREIIKDIDDLVDHHVSSSSAGFSPLAPMCRLLDRMRL